MTIEEGFARHGSHRPGSVCLECERAGDETREVLEQIALEAKDVRHTEMQRIERIRALAATEHDHETSWCARCVEHGVVEQVRREDDEPKPNDDAVTDAYKLGFHAALAAPSTPEPSGLREAREFVDAYIPDTLTHPPSGVQMTGYTVLRDGDTHARFVHGVSDEARLVEFLRVALDGAAPSTEPALDVNAMADALHFTAVRNHNVGEGPMRAICHSAESHRSRAEAILARLAEPR